MNLHELPRYHLKVVRLPIPPPGRAIILRGELYGVRRGCRVTLNIAHETDLLAWRGDGNGADRLCDEGRRLARDEL